MTWTGNSYPDGDKNLVDNKVGIRENFQFLEERIGTAKGDHFMVDTTAAKNGRHNQVAMVTQGDDVDLTPPTETQGVTFIKTLDTDKQVLHHNDGTNIRPLSWGTVWAYAIFDPTTDTITSSSNVTSIAYDGDATKTWTVTFVKNAPSVNYMVNGSSTKNTSTGTSNLEDIYLYGWDGADTKVNEFKIQILNKSGVVQLQSQVNTTKAHVMAVL